MSSDSDSSSISSVEDAKPKPPAAKKAAAASASASASKPKAGDKRKRPAASDEEGESRIPIGSNRFVSLSNFRGRFFVDIREFYEDRASGELKPGKKGISLTLEQWDNLKRKVEAVDKLVKDA